MSTAKVRNRYGTFTNMRYDRVQTFNCFVRHKLRRGHVRDRTITSRNVVFWVPQGMDTSSQKTLSLAVWGEMQELDRLSNEDRATSKYAALHKLFLSECI